MVHRYLASISGFVIGVVFVAFSPADLLGQAARGGTAEGRDIPRTAWGDPDLQGIWSTATVTPLERPAEFAGREFLSDDELTEFERRVVSERDADVRLEGESDVARAYNDFWYDRGTKAIPTRRTSLIVDPPDGRVPPLTPEGAQRAAAGAVRGTDSWEDRNLWERCITRGLPNVMLPGGYNNNYQIFQTPDHVVILAEMIHDARIIPLDGRPHVSPTVRQWMGDSRGRWEGDTLVVEVSNFTEKTNFRGAAGNLRLVERFTRVGADILKYEVTISDSSTFVRPWTIELPAVRIDGPIFEYACHEGNYGMEGILAGARAAERAADEDDDTERDPR